jgi:peptidoglycan hydrolase-like protein with peptidoglycan-binding domain
VLAVTASHAAPALASPQRLGSRVLREGMNGPDVRTLQGDLTHLGFKTPAVGQFGPLTQSNAKRFERKYHLAVNGVVNSGFVRELRLVLASGSAATNATSSGGAASGGAGIGGGSSASANTKSASANTKSSSKSKKTNTGTVAPNQTTVSDSPLAPVAQDGGSQHLGERTLKPGMHGHDVRVLQGYLTIAGYPTDVDGSFGPTTKTNVLNFQTAHAMTADGVVTYAVQLVLRQTVAAALAGGAVGKATINSDGTATPPSGAPAIVQQMIASANQIIDKPYIYGGGHGKWNDSGYDCSGAVSYALHGAGLLSEPEDSTGLESFGSAGPGTWITIYADSAHTFVVVAGIAFDTADYGGPNIPSGTGPRWRSNPIGNLADGGNYIVRHPAGL